MRQPIRGLFAGEYGVIVLLILLGLAVGGSAGFILDLFPFLAVVGASVGFLVGLLIAYVLRAPG